MYAHERHDRRRYCRLPNLPYVSTDRLSSDRTRPHKVRPPVNYYVYVLGSEGGQNYRTYVGWTTDLDHRLKQHNVGAGAKSTRGRRWVLLYAERYDARSAAMSREWHLKRDRQFRKLLGRN